MKSSKIQFGSVSSGSHKMEHLIPAFLDFLESIKLSRSDRNEVRRIRAATRACYRQDAYYDRSDWTSHDYTNLSGILETLAPPYGYFGAHEGDGADFGFWPSWESINDDVRFREILKVGDTSAVPRNFTGFVLHVNDHGNATLYHYSRGKSKEIWSVV